MARDKKFREDSKAFLLSLTPEERLEFAADLMVRAKRRHTDILRGALMKLEIDRVHREVKEMTERSKILVENNIKMTEALKTFREKDAN